MTWLTGYSISSDSELPLQSNIPNYTVSMGLISSHCIFFLNRAELPEVGKPWEGHFLQFLLCSVVEEILVVRVNSFHLSCTETSSHEIMETILLILKKCTASAEWETIEGRWKHWKAFGKESRGFSFQIATFDFVLVIFKILTLFLLLQHLQSNQRKQYSYNSAQESFQRLYWILSAADFVVRDRKPRKVKYGVGLKISDPAARKQQTFNNSMKATISCVDHVPLSLKRIPIECQGLFPLWVIRKVDSTTKLQNNCFTIHLWRSCKFL